MRAMWAQAWGAVIRAAVGNASRMEGIDLGAGLSSEGDHCAIAVRSWAGLVVGFRDPKADPRVTLGAIAEFRGVFIAADKAKCGEGWVIEPLGARDVVGALGEVEEHRGTFIGHLRRFKAGWL